MRMSQIKQQRQQQTCHRNQKIERWKSYLLPLCNKVSVCVSLLQKKLVQFLGDGLALVEKLINISRTLVVDPEDRPQCLNFSLALMWIVFGY